jgi:hypothetical protein
MPHGTVRSAHLVEKLGGGPGCRFGASLQSLGTLRQARPS